MFQAKQHKPLGMLEDHWRWRYQVTDIEETNHLELMIYKPFLVSSLNIMVVMPLRFALPLKTSIDQI